MTPQQNALAATFTEPVLSSVPSLVPERIGKYYVVHEVGRGSTGVKPAYLIRLWQRR